MPSSQTSVPILDEKISELAKKQSLAGGQLSRGNAEYLDMLRRWRDMAGTDVVLVIEAAGAFKYSDDMAPKPRLVEVTDMAAATLLSQSERTGDVIRLATASEAKKYRDYEDALTAWAQKRVADAATQNARNLLESMAGAASGMATTGAGSEPPKLPEIQPSARRDPSDMVPELPPLPADKSTPPPAADGDLDPAFPAFLGQNVKDETVSAVLQAGYSSISQIAEADPVKLVEVKGIGSVTAAKLVTAAAEAVAAQSSGE